MPMITILTIILSGIAGVLSLVAVLIAVRN
jgi:hypothetical protein